ncbi:hypothetical protein SCYAM73S_01367 [Streptomyces cyaneofuscatus]
MRPRALPAVVAYPSPAPPTSGPAVSNRAGTGPRGCCPYSRSSPRRGQPASPPARTRPEGFWRGRSGKSPSVAYTADEPLADDGRGNSLMSFARGGEAKPPAGRPLSAALVALWRAGRVLMVLDRHRQSWELSRGEHRRGRNPPTGSRARAAGGDRAPVDERMRFIGYARFVLAPDRRTEYLALYAGSCAETRTFEPTEEIAAIRWWNLLEHLPGGCSAPGRLPRRAHPVTRQRRHHPTTPQSLELVGSGRDPHRRTQLGLAVCGRRTEPGPACRSTLSSVWRAYNH